MDHLLKDTSIDIDKKLLVCKNAFHISVSSEKDHSKENEAGSKESDKVLNKMRHAGLERISMHWLLDSLDIEVKPPTSPFDEETYKKEKQDREKIWSCLADICVLYPIFAQSTFFAIKSLPCEFILKSISEMIDSNTSTASKNTILNWILDFMFDSENINSALFRQPLFYNQVVSKLIAIINNRSSNDNSSQNHLGLKTIVEHYKMFLKHINGRIAEGGMVDLDSIEGNFLELVLPAISVGNVVENDDKHECSPTINVLSQELISEMFAKIVFRRENHVADWKDFLYCLTVADRKPSPKLDHIEKILHYCNQNLTKSDDVLNLLPVLFSALTKATEYMANTKQEDDSIRYTIKECAMFFIMCCRVLKIGPSESSKSSPIILDSSLAACKLPNLSVSEMKWNHRLEIFAKLLNIFSNFAPSSTIISIEFNTSEEDNLESTISMLMWLKLLLKNLIDNDTANLSVDILCCYNTYHKTNVIRALLSLESRVVEPLIGSILSHVLFDKRNMCKVPPIGSTLKGTGITCELSKSLFIKELLSTYGKLRQIPKLIAKLFICLQSKENREDAKSNEPGTKHLNFSVIKSMTSNDLECLGVHFNKLPSGQYIEVFKTFLYQMESVKVENLLSQADAESEYYKSIMQLANYLIPCFLENTSMADHSVPSPTKDKYLEMLKKMVDILCKFEANVELVKDILYSLYHLATLMQHYDCNSSKKAEFDYITSKLHPLTKNDENAGESQTSSFKRKSESNNSKDKKKRKTDTESPSKTNGGIDPVLQTDQSTNINRIVNQIENLGPKNCYIVSKAIIEWLKSTHNDGNNRSLSEMAPSWLLASVAENDLLQCGIIRVGVEIAEKYIFVSNSLPKNSLEMLRNLGVAASQNLQEKCEVIAEIKKASKEPGLDCCASNIYKIAHGIDILLSCDILEDNKSSQIRTYMEKEDKKSLLMIFGALLPLEHLRGNSELIVSMLLSFILISDTIENDSEFQKGLFTCLLKCWDTTFRHTNVLRYLNFGRLLRSICRAEGKLDWISTNNMNLSQAMRASSLGSLPVTSQLSKIGISLQSDSTKSNPLLDLNKDSIEVFCKALESYLDTNKTDDSQVKAISSNYNRQCAVILMQSIAKTLSSSVTNPKHGNQKNITQEKSIQSKYFEKLSSSFLVGLEHLYHSRHNRNSKTRDKVEEDIQFKYGNDFETTMLMIQGVTAYFSVYNIIDVTSRNQYGMAFPKQLEYLVNFTLTFIFSASKKNHINFGQIREHDIRQCFKFLQTICKNEDAILPLFRQDGSDAFTNQTVTIWKSLLTNNQSNQIKTLRCNTVAYRRTEEYENELIVTILSNTKEASSVREMIMCLLERLEHELNSSDFDNGTGANRLLGILQLLATVTVPVHEESSEESESFGEIRRTALEKAIVLLQVS